MRSRWKNSGNKGLYRRAIQDEIQRPKLPFIKNDTVEKTLVSSNGFTTDDGLSEKLKKEISIIANYIETESLRIERDYQEETREYLKGMLANSVGHMVLGIDYKELQIKTIDNLFGKLDTTFDEVRQGIRRDLDWQE